MQKNRFHEYKYNFQGRKLLAGEKKLPTFKYNIMTNTILQGKKLLCVMNKT